MIRRKCMLGFAMAFFLSFGGFRGFDLYRWVTVITACKHIQISYTCMDMQSSSLEKLGEHLSEKSSDRLSFLSLNADIQAFGHSTFLANVAV